MKKEKDNSVMKLRIIIYILIMMLIFESATFVAFAASNAIFWKDYEVAMEKAAYVDKMATKEYLAWRENR